MIPTSKTARRVVGRLLPSHLRLPPSWRSLTVAAIDDCGVQSERHQWDWQTARRSSCSVAGGGPPQNVPDRPAGDLSSNQNITVFRLHRHRRAVPPSASREWPDLIPGRTRNRGAVPADPVGVPHPSVVVSPEQDWRPQPRSTAHSAVMTTAGRPCFITTCVSHDSSACLFRGPKRRVSTDPDHRWSFETSTRPWV